MVENYRRWFSYERNAHALVLESLQGVESAQRSSLSFQRAIDLLAHIAAARRMWLFRFGVLTENTELFPKDVPFESLPDLLREMEKLWAEYLDQLTDSDLGRVFEYTSYEGKRFRNSIGDILTQLFGHSWYHRGQIAALVRSMGAEPAVTDFVYWAREAV
jgi:uncharacterized damage-inducible protein DinB